MFKAAEARGVALAKAGQWDAFLQNEAAVQPLRMRARATALQRYEMDGDVDKLARSVYPTLFDGKEIVSTERIQGAEGSANLGLAARPEKLRVKMSDGSTKDLDPQQFVTSLKQSLIDPKTAAEKELALNLEMAKQQAMTQRELQVEGEKGRQTRITETQKAGHQASLEGTKFGYQRQLQSENNASAERRSAGNNAATLGAARIGADGRLAVAEARATAAENGGGTGHKRDQRFGQLHDQIAKVYGQGTTGLAGEGKAATEDTRKMASYADALMEADPSLSMAQAIDKSVTEWAKRNPGFKPPRSTGGLGLGN